MSYECIKTSVPIPGVLLIELNRPKALNALNTKLIEEIIAAISKVDLDLNFGAVVLTGNKRAFAAGADIKEMQNLTAEQTIARNFLGNWDEFGNFGIPIISAVEGFALGGGCELAMSTDIIYASKEATFGQPEVKLGVIPGGGGTQRLIKAIGKSKAMEYILTGDTFSGVEAEKWGLVSKTFEPGTVLEEALELAGRLACGPKLAIRACKKSVNLSNESFLKNGLNFERNIFHSLFGGAEQKEGMNAFIEKRKAEWKL